MLVDTFTLYDREEKKVATVEVPAFKERASAILYDNRAYFWDNLTQHYSEGLLHVCHGSISGLTHSDAIGADAGGAGGAGS